MGSHPSLWLIILTATVAVGVGFLVPVLLELRRSAHRLTAVLAIAEGSLGPLMRDLDIAVENLGRVTGDIGAVTDDVRVFSRSLRRVGRTVGDVSSLVSGASLGLGARLSPVQAGIGTGLAFLARNLFRKGVPR